MSRFILLVVLVTMQIASAQTWNPNTPDEAKSWMIQHFGIPADATIVQFGTSSRSMKLNASFTNSFCAGISCQHGANLALKDRSAI